MINYKEALEESKNYFHGNELAATVFLDKYALKDREGNLQEKTPVDMHHRIAKEFARIEEKKYGEKGMKEDEIFDLLDQFKYVIPQGSPMFGIGNKYQTVSISNCYVIPSPVDSYGGILEADQEIVNISKRRGGVGLDISNLRPNGAITHNAAKTSTGIIPFMERFSNSIREVGQSGRRGACLMALNCHHPQILDFISVKRDLKKVTGANISVKLTDEFLNAVKNNTDYEIRFPVDAREKGEDPQISKMISARLVWDKIIENAHAMAEPGIFFWDNVEKETPSEAYKDLGYKTICTNPCGELILQKYGQCILLALNLFSFIDQPFAENSKFDYNKFYNFSYKAQLLLDDMVDLELECLNKIIQKVESDPESDEIKYSELNLWKNIYKTCQESRRTGLGITALGDTIAALGIGYGTQESIDVTDKIYKELKHGSYAASIDMAEKLGPFPIYNFDLEKGQPFLERIWQEYPDLYEKYKKFGRRNIANLTTAPTGSISLLCKVVNHFGTSSGIEPEFQIEYMRKKKITGDATNIKVDSIDINGDKWQHFIVHPAAIEDWMEITGEKDIKKSPWYGYCAQEINWENRVKLQAAAQKHVDHSISSTVNLPNNVTVDEVKKIYETAWQSGLKGITIYRDGCREGVLTKIEDKKPISSITKTNAPKRPKSLEAEIHHLIYKYQKYYVIVGLYGDDKQPYEIFVGINADNNGDIVIPKSVVNGQVEKIKRGIYVLKSDEKEYQLNNLNTDDTADALTRMISTSLRHGVDISFIVQQLEKTKGGLQSFAKVLTRTLKKYIKDGTEVHGETCENCGGKLIRQDGCVKCADCGWTKCG